MESLKRYHLAKNIASTVGKKISDLHFEDLAVEFKDRHSEDPVTNLDKLAQKLIINTIKEHFPYDLLYAEEEDEHQTALDSKALWIIDPIDGTANFMHGSPFWGVSIAFAHSTQVLFGVVYCPELDLFYEAYHGKGAYLNGKPISVSNISLLEHSLITSGITHSLKKEINKQSQKMKFFLKLFEKTQRIRIFGTSVLQICEVAAGHSEAFIGTGLKTWDFAAANKILKESGGNTTDFKNQDALLTHQDIICSNSKIHDQLLKLMDEC